MILEQLIANALPGMRRATLNGREYIVRNMVLIVPGVLPGSRGPLLYKPEVVSRRVENWNGMPLVGYHPRSATGKHKTARDPDVLDKQGLGHSFRSTFNKQLQSEGWFDVENVKAFDKTLADDVKLLPRLEGSGAIELSTGLFTIQNAKKGRHVDGREYIGEVENMEPDHIAILPDKVGACSLKDGCGVLVNELSAVHLNKVFVPVDGGWQVYNEDEVEKCDCEDKENCKCDEKEKKKDVYVGNGLRRAIRKLYNVFCAAGVEGGLDPVHEDGREESGGETEYSAAAAHHNETLNESVVVPDPVPFTYEVTDMKKATVAWLTANHDCWKGQEKTLEAMDESVLNKLKADAEQLQTLLANCRKKFTVEDLSPELAALVQSAAAVTANAKESVIAELLVNVADDCKEALKATYLKLPLEDLQKLRDNMPKPAPKKTPLFTGNATGTDKPKPTENIGEKPLQRPRTFRDPEIVKKFAGK